MKHPSVVLSAALCAACSASSGDGPTVAQVQQALNESFGGLNQTGEKPSFGDANVAAVPQYVTAYTSVMPVQDVSVPMSSYRVALLWGHLPEPNDTSDGDCVAMPATWIGSVSVDEGSIDVTRTLDFGDGDLVGPRIQPNVVSFTSHTLPFVSGLLLHVTTRGDLPTATLHFATSELTTDVDLRKTAASPGSITHTGSDQGLAVVGWDDTAAVCPGGIAYGRWVKMQANVGTQRGHVMASDGTDLGDLRGDWGLSTARSAEVFFGKYIDRSGDYRGLTEGTYGAGQINGTWGDMLSQDGIFQGVYADGLDEPDGRGVFVTKWMTSCQAY